jgi:Kdo2-lipid IVA lauroyltransferase/acyltransferase
LRDRLRRWTLAPDGRPRPNAPFGRGPAAARVLGHVIDFAVAVGSRSPAHLAHGLAVVGGNIEWALRPAKRRILATNLAHAVDRPAASPMVRSLVRREFVNEARRSADLLWAIGRRDEFVSATVVEGREHVIEAAARGRGVVLVGTHVGGWEVATALPSAVLPVPTTVIVADDWLAWAIQHVRSAAGLRVAYAGRLPLEPLRILHRGEALLVLGDDGSRSSARAYPVQLCGETAVMPAGVVSLARVAGAPIVPFTVLPLGKRRWVATIEPCLEPPDRRDGPAGEQAVLQLLADRWTETLRRHPEHWAASFPIDWRESS